MTLNDMRTYLRMALCNKYRRNWQAKEDKSHYLELFKQGLNEKRLNQAQYAIQYIEIINEFKSQKELINLVVDSSLLELSSDGVVRYVKGNRPNHTIKLLDSNFK